MTIDLSTLIGITISVLANFLTAAGLVITYIQLRRSDSEAREEEVERMTRIEVHVETLWDFHIRRSMVEATNRGLGTLNSPFVMTEDAMSMGESLKDDLLDWYADYVTKVPNSNDRDLFIEIERVFGERLIREMCMPNKIQEGTCILIAIALMKGENKLDFPSVVVPREPGP